MSCYDDRHKQVVTGWLMGASAVVTLLMSSLFIVSMLFVFLFVTHPVPYRHDAVPAVVEVLHTSCQL